MDLSILVELLNSYGGRDRVIRLIYYGTQFTSGILGPSKVAEGFKILGDHLTECRTILRLFDDLPMLKYSLSYGLGPKEEDVFIRLCSIISNVLNQLYYPLEHIAWASDVKILPNRNSQSWWTASTFCWAFSSYFEAVKSLRYIAILQAVKKNVVDHEDTNSSIVKDIMRHEAKELLTAVSCGLDFAIAVHWLPAGTLLWSSRLTKWQLGLLGLISSAINLYQTG